MKRLISYFLFLICALSAHGQLLYEISGNGLRQKSYLFAQERLVPAAFLDTVPRLLYYYGKTQALIVETNLNRVDDQRALLTAARADSLLYRNNLQDEEYQQLNLTLLNQLKLTESSWVHMQPGLLLTQLRDQVYRDSLGFQENESMENFFQLLANEQGHEIIGLDNLQETTLMLFHRIPLHQQVHQLISLMQHPEREAEVGRALMENYRKGDLTEIAYTLRGPQNRSTLAYSDYAAYMDRNTRWVEELRAPMERQGCFLMLDAEYLGGQDGLIAKLRKAGYKVKPANRRNN